MKKLLLVFILGLIYISSFSQKRSDYIVIKHIGEQDKPLYPIAIAEKGSDTANIEKNMRWVLFPKERLESFERSIIIMDTTDYLVIDSLTESYNKSMNRIRKPSKQYRPFGALRITHYINDKAIYSFETYTPEGSYEYLLSLYEKCGLLQNSMSTKKALTRIMCRIYPYIKDVTGLEKVPCDN